MAVTHPAREGTSRGLSCIPARPHPAAMNCRAFRDAHVDLTDGTLPLAARTAARAHLDVCATCARFDAGVRRSLLLARNLAPVVPSAGFRQRLAQRIARERATTRSTSAVRRPGGRSLAAVISLAFAAGMAIAVVARAHRGMPSPDPRIFAPVASASSSGVDRGTTLRADFLAGASAGIPLWSAAALIDEAPVRFASQRLPLRGPSR
jgi:hypothetical protein